MAGPIPGRRRRGAALAGSAWAQDGAKPAAPAAAPVVTGEACCEPCLKKVCVAEPTKIKTSKTFYDCKCVDYCLPKCGGLFSKCGHGHGSDCGDCSSECADCGKPRVKRVLIKKSKSEEKDGIKCVVKEVAPCAPVCCPAEPCLPPAGTIVPAPAPVMERIPAPKPPAGSPGT